MRLWRQEVVTETSVFGPLIVAQLITWSAGNHAWTGCCSSTVIIDPRNYSISRKQAVEWRDRSFTVQSIRRPRADRL